MPKYFLIVAILITLSFGGANAQQKQAMLPNQDAPLLTTMEVPGADFDIVIASIKPGACTNADCGRSERSDQWRTRVYLVPKGEALPSPE